MAKLSMPLRVKRNKLPWRSWRALPRETTDDGSARDITNMNGGQPLDTLLVHRFQGPDPTYDVNQTSSPLVGKDRSDDGLTVHS